ncbi:MAG TPA: alcohol dehydrogenase catalytic domain-containing protein [Solirubrobacteraceae bacterium]
MELLDVPAPGEPGRGEVVLRPEVVGVCGSDVHLFHGDLGDDVFPRIQGHEISAVIDALGPGSDHLRVGERVAVWPVLACGSCYPCSIGRENACANIAIIGAHVDGALQERLVVAASQVFAVGDMAPAVTAFVEPTSIGVRTVVRARVSAEDRVVVLGAGPIGQAVCLAASDLGATVLMADVVPERLEHARAMGAEEVVCGDAAAVADQLRDWAGADGVGVLIETTGVPAVVRSAFDVVAPAGRLVLVALSHHEVSLPLMDFPIRELDVLGVSCCNAAEFGAAVDLVRRNEDAVARLITDEFAFERAPEALRFVAAGSPELMKAVIAVSP